MRRQDPAHRERGATAVEFALLTPLLAMLLVGIVEIGTMYNRQQDLDAAAREAGRMAVHPELTSAEITAIASNALNEPDAVAVSIDPAVNQPCDGRVGDVVTVTLERPDSFDLLFIGSRDVVLQAKAVFQCTD